jgi:hypothetical protein
MAAIQRQAQPYPAVGREALDGLTLEEDQFGLDRSRCAGSEPEALRVSHAARASGCSVTPSAANRARIAMTI